MHEVDITREKCVLIKHHIADTNSLIELHQEVYTNQPTTANSKQKSNNMQQEQHQKYHISNYGSSNGNSGRSSEIDRINRKNSHDIFKW